MVTVWSKRAKLSLQKAYGYIAKDSIQNAAKVRDEIIDASIELIRHPEMFPPDKYKTITMEIGGLLKNIVTEYLTESCQMKFALYVCDIPAGLRWNIKRKS